MITISNMSLSVTTEPTTPRLPGLARAMCEQLPPRSHPLRFSIVAIEESTVQLEITLAAWDAGDAFGAALADVELLKPRIRRLEQSPFCVVQIVPTGIACEFGGYAGDACPATNLLAAAADFVVTHPNAVNASELNEMADNVLYVEGRSLDDFLLGRLALAPVNANRIGTLVDPSGKELMDYVVNALNTARTAAGIDCDTYTVLDGDLGVEIAWSSSGCAVGTVANTSALLEGAKRLIANGAQAIGGVSVIHGVTSEMFHKHLAGRMPNPSGGVEAIITHLISKLYRVPAAHAPLPYYQELKGRHTDNPRTAAEFISIPHYVCVLKGLHKAPRLVPMDEDGALPEGTIGVENVGAVVVPADALGGVPALAAEFQGIPVIAVRENNSILNVTLERLPLQNVIEAGTYLEAAGLVLALRNGISLASLQRPVRDLCRI